MTRVKVCGLTTPGDAEAAMRLGASFVGVVFAASPRRVDVAGARTVLAPTRGAAAAVGVFGPGAPDAIVRTATDVGLDVIQLHGDPSADDVARVRGAFHGEVWAAHRVRDGRIPAVVGALANAADAVVLDAFHGAALGGTGMALDWEALAPSLVALRGRRASLILAGGLRPANVAHAVSVLAPDVVDVSSGVESAPGVKDHLQMRAFIDAVRDAALPRG